MKAKTVPVRTGHSRKYNAAGEKELNIIGRRIAAARKRCGLTITDLSERLNDYGVKVSRGAVGKWETGDTVPNAYQLMAIANALGIEDRLSYFTGNHTPLLDEAGIRKLEDYKADLIASGKYRPVPAPAAAIHYLDMPVSSLAASAGTGTFLDDNAFDMIRFPEDKVPSGADFGVRISGDSMEPVYHDGQIVWVQKCDTLSVGQVGVFIYDGSGYLKRYGEQEPGEEDAEEFTDSCGAVRSQPVLESYNPEYEPRPVHPDMGFQIVGRVL